MKIAILGNADSIHTRRWITALCQRDINIVLISLNNFDKKPYENLKNFAFYTLGNHQQLSIVDNKLKKTNYLFSIRKIKKILSNEKPDILHAHYASSYGLVGALCNYHPFIISVWGSDVYEFPRANWLQKKIIEYNLKKADVLLSTSHVMAQEASKYTSKNFIITPFGIDTDFFKPLENTKSLFNEDEIVIGTIKSLDKKYGTEYLIKAFKIVKDRHPELKLKLMIVGSGPEERIKYLKQLCKDLNCENDTLFVGKVDYETLPAYYNMLDVYVAVSITDSESFGVAVIEASSCGKPVVVSNTGGLPEVVAHNYSGIIVEPENETATADAIEKLITDEKLRYEMGKNGRQRVKELFEWSVCVDKMINVYNDTIIKGIK